MSNEVLHTNDAFNVVLKDGRYGIEPNKLSVVVMAYTSVKGLPVTIGVIDEVNPFRDGGKSLTLVTGYSNDEDPDIFSTAQRKLKDESGYDVMDPDRWTFLGFLTDGKYSSNSSPCFACDLTGIEPIESTDSSNEPSSFRLLQIKDAFDTDDCFIPALFMKMFRYIFGNSEPKLDDTQEPEPKQTDSVDIKDNTEPNTEEQHGE